MAAPRRVGAQRRPHPCGEGERGLALGPRRQIEMETAPIRDVAELIGSGRADFPHPACLSDKTSRLHPRHVAPKRGQAYEPEVPVEVRELIIPAPASP
jgi:hypothetical protein